MVFFPCIGHHILARSVKPNVAVIAPNHVLSIIRLSTRTVYCHFLRRFHRPDHFRLRCGCCWEHFHATSLETFHEMPSHFWLIPVLGCRVDTTANCSGICNREEATVTTSRLLLYVWPCQGYTFGRAVQQPRNLLLQKVCGSASVRRVKYVYVSCKAPNITHTDPMIASKVQNLDKWAVRSADTLATTWLEETYRLQPINRLVGDG